ncbi:hypothetical protein F4679DRAFT_582995 [Xylaria curta]|nr:hypothetical protein F4679DRAFT_582995 [Xylaria curta]
MDTYIFTTIIIHITLSISTVALLHYYAIVSLTNYRRRAPRVLRQPPNPNHPDGDSSQTLRIQNGYTADFQ